MIRNRLLRRDSREPRLARVGLTALLAITACAGPEEGDDSFLDPAQTADSGFGDAGSIAVSPSGSDASAAASPDAGTAAITPGPDAGSGLKGDAGSAAADASPMAPDGAQPDAGLSTASSDAGDGAGETAGSACAGGRTLLASDAVGVSTRVSGYAMVQFNVATTTHFEGLSTTLTVPEKPTTSPTLYAWPGLEPYPGGANFNPVGQGVLQPVLTWGTSCGSYAPPRPTGWWIAPQYVNPYTSDQSFYGCKGGKYIDVQVGDPLDITMSLKGTVWSQLVVDRSTRQMTSFDMDLKGQAQNWALFEIEQPKQTKPVGDVIFTDTTLTFAEPDPMACQPSKRGAQDYFTAPVLSQDGTKCCIAKIVLRAQGVPATTPNAP
jgi:hypothetical protein